jgi:hypothetical protein
VKVRRMKAPRESAYRLAREEVFGCMLASLPKRVESLYGV